MSYKIASLDVHKKVVMVVVADRESSPLEFHSRRFGSMQLDRRELITWLAEEQVQEAVMESTAQYWRPFWNDLEAQGVQLHLAQAHSNRAPRGRKHDFGDAQRLLRRLLSGELILSFVPGMQQRHWRTMTRGKVQLVRDRVRLNNQLEALLEEMQIKLSSVVSTLLGLSGRRILQALAGGESDPVRLAALGDHRLKCTPQALADALTGRVEPLHRQMLTLYLERLELLDRQIEQMDRMAADAMRQHEDAVLRLAEVPGFGADSAQQLIAEVGPDAHAFPSAPQLASWVAVCPGRQESAGKNASAHSAKGNPAVRRILTEAAQAAVRKKGSSFEITFHRWVARLGYSGAIWAIAHKLCRVVWKVLHDGVRYRERGEEGTPKARKQRAQKMIRALRKMGYQVQLSGDLLSPSIVPMPTTGNQ